MSSEWHVITVQPRAEYLSAEELTRDGHEIFFPCVKSEYARAGHSDKPLFPGYMFIRFDPEQGGWPSFRMAHRVIGWVKFQGVVPTIPNEIIEALAERLDEKSGGEGLWRRFQPGHLVQVVAGALEGLGEVVEEAKSPTGKAKVLIEFMGRMVEAKVPWDALQFTHEQVEQKPRRTRGKGRWTQEFRPRLVSH
jgi:transcriptional antiterminator RfaH